MVAIRKSSSLPRRRMFRAAQIILALVLVATVFFWMVVMDDVLGNRDLTGEKTTTGVKVMKHHLKQANEEHEVEQTAFQCPYTAITDLTDEERFPKAGKRHMVDPPKDTKITLVCCETTQGPWSIAVHHAWAPFGARRFLEMVTSDYFSNKVPLMRCVEDFLCQFGLAGEASEQYAKKIPDDVAWLPEGSEHRQNHLGAKRFQEGYFAYAGSGPNSRGRQLFVALDNSGSLGGGSPWEVPWGELVGEHSFDTLEKIYTGYGEDGPDQYRLLEKGAHQYVEKEFPKLDWITSCTVVDEGG